MFILFICLANIYPRGYAGGMKEYADKFHQILCWTDHYDDYDKILLDFIRFIKVITMSRFLNIFISY